MSSIWPILRRTIKLAVLSDNLKNESILQVAVMRSMSPVGDEPKHQLEPRVQTLETLTTGQSTQTPAFVGADLDVREKSFQ